MQNDKGSQLRSNPSREPFTTIDDLAQLAEKLVSGLEKLSRSKHPLDIRRGVGKGVGQNMTDDRESVQIDGAGRTYFLDVEKSKKGDPYLKITEGRKGKEGKFERNSIFVFPEDADEFANAVSEMTAKLG